MPSESYTRTARLLHWVVAGGLLANVALGLWGESFPDAWVRTAIDTHKSLGITLLGLVIARLLWRAANPPPALTGPPALRMAAHAAHALLYAAMLALPLSGWLHDSAWDGAAMHPMRLFGLFEWPRIAWVQSVEPAARKDLHALFGAWHAWLSYGLYALVALHLAAVAKHEFVDRDGVLARMLPRRAASAR